MNKFLNKTQNKIVFCTNNSLSISSIQSELEQMLPSYKVYSEYQISKKDSISLRKNDALITRPSFLLTYLRQGLLNLSEVDYLIFEPKKLLFNEDNWVESIIIEFFIPLFNLSSKMPKILILNSHSDIVSIVIFIFRIKLRIMM